MNEKMNEKWYELTPEQVANKLGSDAVQGLDRDEAEKRSRIGAEQLREEKVQLAESMADISHQMRTPLTAVNLLLAGLSDPDATEEARRNSLRTLRRQMGNITDAVLASALKGLISNGIVARRSYDEIPPRVEYSLTEKGESVVPILQSICRWAGVFYKDDGDMPMIQCRKCLQIKV